MTQDEIKEGVEKHSLNIIMLKAEIEVEVARMRVFQTICKHPKLYKTSCMGDTGTYCPDCRYST